MLTRALVSLVLTLPLAAGCDDEDVVSSGRDGGEGRLSARPQPASSSPAPAAGLNRFGPGDRGILYVSRSYSPREPAPLALVLHGAGGNGINAVERMIPFAERGGGILVGVKSVGPTWDLVLGGYGEDIQFVDHALQRVFSRFSVDPRRVGVSGFSDGASYSLSVGVTNGDLFRHVVAFSPGFADLDPHGSPDVFITHGTSDRTLPIDETSGELVPELENLGLDVTFVEFPGKHEIPDDLVPRAMGWLTG